MVEQLADRMVYAAEHAAIRPLGNVLISRGSPPDNARIILASEVVEACTELGLSGGLRYADPKSFPVQLYETIAPLIWPTRTGKLSDSRKTFERMRRAEIIWN
jgi:hypothetical protein